MLSGTISAAIHSVILLCRAIHILPIPASSVLHVPHCDSGADRTSSRFDSGVRSAHSHLPNIIHAMRGQGIRGDGAIVVLESD